MTGTASKMSDGLCVKCWNSIGILLLLCKYPKS